MNIKTSLIPLAIELAALCAVAPTLRADEFDPQRQQVLALGKLTSAPPMMEAEGFASDENVKAIYFDALPYQGKPTNVFAWLGLPEKREGKVPGIVLVHGGGGTAFKEWVTRWNERGFAAISIAVEGQTDQKDPSAKSGIIPTGWKQHAWSGPWRVGIYQDSDKPLKDQWMYHAVADTILANSLLRSLPQVDENKVGLMGVSWGGVITSTVVGIDNRFAFAIPTYGCGNLSKAENQYGRALGNNETYKNVWDPMQRSARAKMPILWFSWPGDLHFPLNCQAASYRAAKGPRMVTLVPGMRHGHGPAWTRPESYAFAKAVAQTGDPWCQQTEAVVTDGKCRVLFTSTSQRPFDKAILVSTTDSGATGQRTWVESAATLKQDGNQWIATASLPSGTTAWIMNLQNGELIVSSEFQETRGANSNGAAPSRRAELFARIDKDKDGKLTSDDYVGHFRAAFERLDADDDGTLDAKEFTNAVAMKFGDTDKDGKLTRDEYQAIFTRQFSNLDENKDGVLTADEF
jgi:dienelactone hydrolase/Ca2+-binding EF-hand superfamily protein